MYRTHFDTRAGVWRVQLLRYGFIWTSICEDNVLMGWRDYNDCQAFIERVGLHRVYRSYHDSAAAQIMSGGYQPLPQVLRAHRA